MHTTAMKHLTAAGRRAAAAALLAAAGAAACSSDRLLEVRDPDIINPENVANADGAEALRVGALGRFRTALASSDVNNGEGYFLLSGLLADEWKSTNSFTQTQEIDGRNIRKIGNVTDNSTIEGTYRNLNRARVAAIIAANSLRQYRPTATSSIAQMYMLRAYAELYMAEGWCNGVTFGDASGAEIVLGEQMTTQQALQTALATFDSTLAVLGSATDATAQVVGPAARIGRARALVGLNRLADAAAAVPASAVPTGYSGFQFTYLQTTGDNGVWALNNNQKRYAVGDPSDLGVQGSTISTLGTHQNSLPFATARDPRVPVTTTSAPAFVTTYPTIAQQLWATRDAAIPVVTGVDARLIEAEAALNAGQSAAYLPILNALRSTVTGLTALTDPGTPAARVDQFFREKAFWQFSRGYRLGDMRRLVRQYGRTANAVYPVGTFFQSGSPYGTDVVFPLPQAEQNARADFRGCFDFNA